MRRDFTDVFPAYPKHGQDLKMMAHQTARDIFSSERAVREWLAGTISTGQLFFNESR